MVAWMRQRGHGWAPAWEMTASMFLPSLAAIALLAAELVEDPGALLAVQHSLMFPAMLVRDAAAAQRVHRPPRRARLSVTARRRR
jgi:hypothetical protein